MTTLKQTTGAGDNGGPVSPISHEAEPRIGVLAGDRICTTCDFNLAGQTIVRERHYGLLIVRCPECGTPAALQEYPLLGRWANRLGYVTAGAWLLGNMALLMICAMFIWALGQNMAEQMAQPYQSYVTNLWQQRAAANIGPSQNGGGWPGTYQADQAWWAALDKSQVFADAGGWAGAVAWRGLWLGVFTFLVVAPIGAAIAVATPHAKSRSRLLLLLVIAALSAAFWAVVLFDQGAFGMMMYYNGGWGAWREQAARLGPIAIGLGVMCAAIGMWTGRPAARGLVCLLLPPRLRGPMAFLWIADGKPIPR